MKKQKKQLIVMVCLLLVCVVAYGGMTMYYSNKAKEEDAKEEADKMTAFSIDYTTITGISYISGEENVTLVKNDDTWYSSDDTEVNIDESTVETDMLYILDSVSAEQKIETPEDISQYGFAKDDEGNITAETNTIVLIDDADNTYALYIGAANPYDSSQYYLMVEGDNSVYVIGTSLVDGFSKTVEDMTVEETTAEETSAEKTTEAEDVEETT